MKAASSSTAPSPTSSHNSLTRHRCMHILKTCTRDSICTQAHMQAPNALAASAADAAFCSSKGKPTTCSYRGRPNYLAQGEGQLGSCRPAPAQADLEGCAADSWRILGHVHHVSNQGEAVHPCSGYVGLHSQHMGDQFPEMGYAACGRGGDHSRVLLSQAK